MSIIKELENLIYNYKFDLDGKIHSLTKVVDDGLIKSFIKFEQDTGIKVVETDEYRSDYNDHDTWFWNWYIQYKGLDLVLQWSGYYDSHCGMELDDSDFCVMVEKEVVVKKLFPFKEKS